MLRPSLPRSSPSPRCRCPRATALAPLLTPPSFCRRCPPRRLALTVVPAVAPAVSDVACAPAAPISSPSYPCPTCVPYYHAHATLPRRHRRSASAAAAPQMPLLPPAVGMSLLPLRRFLAPLPTLLLFRHCCAPRRPALAVVPAVVRAVSDATCAPTAPHLQCRIPAPCASSQHASLARPPCACPRFAATPADARLRRCRLRRSIPSALRLPCCSCSPRLLWRHALPVAPAARALLPPPFSIRPTRLLALCRARSPA